MIVRQKLRYLVARHPILTTYDTRSNAVLKMFSSFLLNCFKKCKDFCLLNVIKHVKYNLSLSFILNRSFLTAREYFAVSSTLCFLFGSTDRSIATDNRQQIPSTRTTTDDKMSSLKKNTNNAPSSQCSTVQFRSNRTSPQKFHKFHRFSTLQH